MDLSSVPYFKGLINFNVKQWYKCILDKPQSIFSHTSHHMSFVIALLNRISSYLSVSEKLVSILNKNLIDNIISSRIKRCSVFGPCTKIPTSFL